MKRQTRQHKARASARCPVCGEVHARLGLEIVGDVMRRTVTDCAGQMVQISGGAWAYKAHIIAAHAEVKRYEVIAEGVRYVTDCATMQSKGFTRILSAACGPQKILPLRYWQIEGGHGAQGEYGQIEHNAIEQTQAAYARAEIERENAHRLQLSQMGFAGLGWRVRV